MLDRIVEYFKEKYKVNVEVSQSVVYHDDFILEVETKLTENELDEFSDFLKNLGFLLCETFEYQASTRKYYGYKEFRLTDGSVVLTVYYKKVKENNRMIFYIKEIEVRVNPYLPSHRIFS